MDITLESFALPALVLLIKATCLLLVALGASVLLQRASAGSRHLVWLVALVGVLAMPAVAAWGPLPLRVLPRSGGCLVPRLGPFASLRVTSERLVTQAATAFLASAPRQRPTRRAHRSRPRPSVPPAPTAGSLIALGTMLFAAWAAVALALALHRLTARGRSAASWPGRGRWMIPCGRARCTRSPTGSGSTRRPGCSGVTT